MSNYIRIYFNCNTRKKETSKTIYDYDINNNKIIERRYSFINLYYYKFQFHIIIREVILFILSGTESNNSSCYLHISSSFNVAIVYLICNNFAQSIISLQNTRRALYLMKFYINNEKKIKSYVERASGIRKNLKEQRWERCR
jgi:hypothetical protein